MYQISLTPLPQSWTKPCQQPSWIPLIIGLSHRPSTQMISSHSKLICSEYLIARCLSPAVWEAQHPLFSSISIRLLSTIILSTSSPSLLHYHRPLTHHPFSYRAPLPNPPFSPLPAYLLPLNHPNHNRTPSHYIIYHTTPLVPYLRPPVPPTTKLQTPHSSHCKP